MIQRNPIKQIMLEKCKKLENGKEQNEINLI